MCCSCCCFIFMLRNFRVCIPSTKSLIVSGLSIHYEKPRNESSLQLVQVAHLPTWSITHSSRRRSSSLVASRSAGRSLLAPSCFRHRKADCCKGVKCVISTPFSSVSTSACSSFSIACVAHTLIPCIICSKRANSSVTDLDTLLWHPKFHGRFDMAQRGLQTRMEFLDTLANGSFLQKMVGRTRTALSR